jgi:hypothetical protein
MTNEIHIDSVERMYADELLDAIDLASDQDQMTWLLSDGKRIAAIVPVSEAEAIEVANAVMSDPQIMGAIREAVEEVRKQ